MADGGVETNSAGRDARPLRIVHVMRAPVGGLFRHVRDLSREQARAGHSVGLIVDKETGGARAESALESLAPCLTLGVTRIAMQRLPHWTDPLIAHRVARILDRLKPDVVHGHGAKGGLYARLPALTPRFPPLRRPVANVYTPHGGSLHFEPTSSVNRIMLFVEKALEGVTDIIPFESDFARRRFLANVGVTHARAIVAHNGVAPEEFEPVAPAAGAADFLYVGEWRRMKGLDTLFEALARLNAAAAPPFRLALVGAGPDEAKLRALAQTLGLTPQIAFLGPMDARAAFRLGRVVVVPSRAESLPYIVLEAVAARRPVVATNVGGIPEIFGPFASKLAPSGDAEALAAAMLDAATAPDDIQAQLTEALANFVQDRFSLIRMVEVIVATYREAMAEAARGRPRRAPPLAEDLRSGDQAK
jgi:glycosyltransferase involved in cell wall biosynthesis